VYGKTVKLNLDFWKIKSFWQLLWFDKLNLRKYDEQKQLILLLPVNKKKNGPITLYSPACTSACCCLCLCSTTTCIKTGIITIFFTELFSGGTGLVAG